MIGKWVDADDRGGKDDENDEDGDKVCTILMETRGALMFSILDLEFLYPDFVVFDELRHFIVEDGHAFSWFSIDFFIYSKNWFFFIDRLIKILLDDPCKKQNDKKYDDEYDL